MNWGIEITQCAVGGPSSPLIAGLDLTILYALLGSHPHLYVNDLPMTLVRHAEDALAAQAVGLSNVRIGNRHLLSRD